MPQLTPQLTSTKQTNKQTRKSWINFENLNFVVNIIWMILRDSGHVWMQKIIKCVFKMTFTKSVTYNQWYEQSVKDDSVNNETVHNNKPPFWIWRKCWILKMREGLQGQVASTGNCNLIKNLTISIEMVICLKKKQFNEKYIWRRLQCLATKFYTSGSCK